MYKMKDRKLKNLIRICTISNGVNNSKGGIDWISMCWQNRLTSCHGIVISWIRDFV